MAAGIILIVLGGAELMLAFVFGVLGILYSSPGSLPSYIDLGTVPTNAVPRLLGVGLLVAVLSVLQLWSGAALVRGRTERWLRVLAGLLAALGVVATLAGSLSTGSPNPIFLPITAAYLFVLLTAAFPGREVPIGGDS